MLARYASDIRWLLARYVPDVYRCLSSIRKIRAGYSLDVRLIRKTDLLLKKRSMKGMI